MKKRQPLHDYDRMPFGPHKGLEMRRVPAKHLLNLHPDERAKYPEVDAYVRRAERVLKWELKNEKRNSD